MPIGSKSYYDTLDPSINHPEPKLAMFRRNDGKTAKAEAKPQAAEPTHTTAAPHASVQTSAMHIDAVVTQIIELATRTGAVLQRAEEMARRAEEIYCAIAEATDRAEAAAMRAELAASRAELNSITGFAPGQVDAPPDVEEPDARAQELEMVAQITERLRNGMQQIEGLTASYTEPERQQPEASSSLELVNSDAPMAAHADIASAAVEEVNEPVVEAVSPTPPIGGIRSDFDRQPMSAKYDGSSFARTPNAPNESDALAHSLVSVCHDTGMPRVSPYIIQVPAAKENGSKVRNGNDGPVHLAV